MTNSQPEFGKLVPDGVEDRDAIHIATLPVEAGENLWPSTKVTLKDGEAYKGPPNLGIVDPFLQELVKEGERFWLFLYPGTITNLRHHWEHPSIDELALTKEDKARAYMERIIEGEEKWLTVEKLLSDVGSYENDSEPSLPFDLSWYIQEDGSTQEEFARHFKVLTGKETTKTHYRYAC